MAKKPLVGKRWFYASGARAAAQAKPLWLGQERQNWAKWAKDAYTDGWCEKRAIRKKWLELSNIKKFSFRIKWLAVRRGFLLSL